MLVARMNVIFTSRGLWCDSEFAPLFYEMRGYWIVVHKLIDFSVPHSQTMKHSVSCAYCYLVYINVLTLTWMRMPILQGDHSSPASDVEPMSMPLWWSQIRPVQDSCESGTATVVVPDSYRVRIRLCTNVVSVSNTLSIVITHLK